MAPLPNIGQSGQGKVSTSKKGGSGRTKKFRVNVPNENVVKFVLQAIQDGNGLIEFPVFNEDAAEVQTVLDSLDDETYTDLLESFPEDVTHLSFESFFGVDLSEKNIEYVGTIPLHERQDDGTYKGLEDGAIDEYPDDVKFKYGNPEKGPAKYVPHQDWVELMVDNKVDQNVIYDATSVINGWYYPLIADTFDDEKVTKLGVGIGRNHNHRDEDGEVDEFAKRRSVAFAKEQGKSSADAIATAMWNQGTISESSYQEYQDNEKTLEELKDEARAEVPAE